MQKGIITRLISHKILYNLKKNNANFDKIFNFYTAKYSLSLSDRKLVLVDFKCNYTDDFFKF